ncbi:MAG: N-6 DNA methylase, partial [Oscillospiraceae bacterium]|nr:N-6 DNA methylase [Oscillospiraceae bacterium]
IYEYFLNKFAKNIASDDGVFFTPKSLVKMIVNVLEPKKGILLDPACGSGGMFVQTGDFVNHAGMSANAAMTFYGQEKVEYNAQLCLMNMAVHGLNGKILSGNEANTFYHDAHALEGCCDYVMANPPFNVDKVKSESAMNAGRLPFGVPSINAAKEFGNGNYLWISYFYAYLNEKGRAGFVMASSATDSSGKDRDIRQKLVETGHVDVMMSVGNNFFYTKSLPCSIWFFDKGKAEAIQDHVLFIDARNYYTVVDRTLNEWSEWQLKNLNAIVWLYRGEVDKYQALLREYAGAIADMTCALHEACEPLCALLVKGAAGHVRGNLWDADPANDPNFETLKERLNWELEVIKKAVAISKEELPKKQHKHMDQEAEVFATQIREILLVLQERDWLTEKFGNNGVYQDIPGLCKMASRAEIAEKNYSLTPGVYVGVAAVEDEETDFAQRMQQIHLELLSLHEESNVLMQTISDNIKELGL